MNVGTFGLKIIEKIFNVVLFSLMISQYLILLIFLELNKFMYNYVSQFFHLNKKYKFDKWVKSVLQIPKNLTSTIVMSNAKKYVSLQCTFKYVGMCRVQINIIWPK